MNIKQLKDSANAIVEMAAIDSRMVKDYGKDWKTDFALAILAEYGGEYIGMTRNKVSMKLKARRGASAHEADDTSAMVAEYKKTHAPIRKWVAEARPSVKVSG